MIDVLFAFCYENRIMENDMSRESGITINKLSSILSCHVVDSTLHDVLLQSYKRALSYPFIRHFGMAN